MRRTAPFLNFPFLLCGMALLFGSAAFADLVKGGPKKPDKNEVLIPEARDATVRFGAGRTVLIELTAAVGSLGHMEFVIRDRPQNGTLSAITPHPKENNKASVTYTHRAGAPLQDRFTFACRLDDGPSSVAGVITLIGQTMEPKLEVKQTPRIGKVVLGGEGTGKVSVKNVGVAPFAGEIKWPAPWVGPPRLNIKPGETQEFIIALRPMQSGNFRLDMELQPGLSSSKLMVFAECFRALTVSPGDLSLSFNSKSGVRDGVITLVNSEADPLAIVLKLPARLSGPQQLDLLPRERREVKLELASSDMESFRDDVEIVAGKEIERVLVQAVAKPGELRLIKPEKPEMDLGQIKEKENASAMFMVRNVGGQEIIVEARCNPPLTLDTLNASFRLAPMQERQVPVTLSGAPVGAFTGEIKLSSGTVSFPILVKAKINSAPPPMATNDLPAAPAYPKKSPDKSNAGADDLPKLPNALQQMLASVLATEGLPPPPEMINPDLERVERADLVSRKSTSITISWKKPTLPPAAWIIEFANYIKDTRSGIISKDWRVCSTAKLVAADKDKVGLLIHSLKPNTNYEARIMAVDRDGKVSYPSPVFQLVTADSWHFPSWLLWTFLLLSLALVFYVLIRVRRGDFPAFG